MKPLPVNPLTATGKGGQAVSFVILVLAAVAILATGKPKISGQN